MAHKRLNILKQDAVPCPRRLGPCPIGGAWR